MKESVNLANLGLLEFRLVRELGAGHRAQPAHDPGEAAASLRPIRAQVACATGGAIAVAGLHSDHARLKTELFRADYLWPKAGDKRFSEFLIRHFCHHLSLKNQALKASHYTQVQ